MDAMTTALAQLATLRGNLRHATAKCKEAQSKAMESREKVSAAERAFERLKLADVTMQQCAEAATKLEAEERKKLEIAEANVTDLRNKAVSDLRDKAVTMDVCDAPQSRAQTFGANDFNAWMENAKYQTVTTKGIDVKRGEKILFSVPGRPYDIGCTEMPMEVFDAAKKCNLSNFFLGVYQEPGANIFEQINSFLTPARWHYLTFECDLFTLPIDLAARQKGRQKCDVPNVNFQMAIFLLEKLPKDFVFYNPLYKGTDTTVSIVNLSHVLNKLKEMRVRVQTHKAPPGQESQGLDTVFYQHGKGDPPPYAMRAIYAATGLTSENIMHMHLVPGKAGKSEHLMGGNCYQEFAMSVATILNELSIVDGFTRAEGKAYINNIRFVLDPFSAYSVFTATAVLGYGIKDMCSVLQGRGTEYGTGFKAFKYTPMKPCA